MTDTNINLSTFDVQRIEPLVARNFPSRALPKHLDSLLGKIYSCVEIPPVAVPPYMVTMNSRVRLLDITTGRESECTLVFPQDADASAGRISVLAPLGASLFGAHVGAVIDVATPINNRQYRVMELLFQPEAAGQYDL